MFKACGLGSRASRLPLLPIRVICAPRVPRSFATTLHVSRQNTPSRIQLPSGPSRRDDHPEFETNKLKDDELQVHAESSFRSILRDVHLQREADRDDEVANNDQDKPKERRKESELDAEIRAPQDFHSQLHPTLLANIMQMRPLLRGMPVYDSTFDAVRSGRNLFIQAPCPSRTLQYLLPLAHSIIERGVCKRKHEPKSNDHKPARPSELLVICPTLDDAREVHATATRLLKSHGAGLDMVVLGSPMNSGLLKYKERGYNVLISTPEILLHWTSLGHAKALLVELLQDLKTLVVDGQASSLRHPVFHELLGGVMEDMALPGEAQRLVISDGYDPKLRRLMEVVLPGDHELHHEPRLDEIQELRGARLDYKQELKQEWKKRIRDNKLMRNTILNESFDTQSRH